MVKLIYGAGAIGWKMNTEEEWSSCRKTLVGGSGSLEGVLEICALEERRDGAPSKNER